MCLSLVCLLSLQRVMCDWETYEEDIVKLQEITTTQLAAEGKNVSVLPSVQPFHALIYPFSLEEMQQVGVKCCDIIVNHVVRVVC